MQLELPHPFALRANGLSLVKRIFTLCSRPRHRSLLWSFPTRLADLYKGTRMAFSLLGHSKLGLTPPRPTTVGTPTRRCLALNRCSLLAVQKMTCRVPRWSRAPTVTISVGLTNVKMISQLSLKLGSNNHFSKVRAWVTSYSTFWRFWLNKGEYRTACLKILMIHSFLGGGVGERRGCSFSWLLTKPWSELSVCSSSNNSSSARQLSLSTPGLRHFNFCFRILSPMGRPGEWGGGEQSTRCYYKLIKKFRAP